MKDGIRRCFIRIKDFKEHVHAYLFYIGYQPTDIENLLLDLEQKIREANEQAES